MTAAKLTISPPQASGDDDSLLRAKRPALDRASVVAPVLKLMRDPSFFGKIQQCVSPSLETLLAAVRDGGVRAKTFRKIATEINGIGGIEDSTTVIFLGVFEDQVQKVADKLKAMDCESEMERLEAKRASIVEEYDEKIAVLSKKFTADKKKLVAERDARVGELQQLFKESHPVSLLLFASSAAGVVLFSCARSYSRARAVQDTAPSPGDKGSRLSNNIYVIPGTSRKVSIRDAAYHCVGDVLSCIGGRAKIKDVIYDINELFLEHNPDGWQTTNTQKRAEDGGFTAYGLRFLARAKTPAKPERWAVKPTFRLEDDDELVLLGDEQEESQRESQRESEQDEEISDIDE